MKPLFSPFTQICLFTPDLLKALEILNLLKADVRCLFLQIVYRLSDRVYNSKLDMLDSCKQVKYRGFFSKILAVLLVSFVQSIIVQIESVLQLGILLTFITLSNKSLKT